MPVTLMGRKDVDRVDLTRIRRVLLSRRTRVDEPDDVAAMLCDEREGARPQPLHVLATTRAVVPESIEHLVRHEPAIGGAPRIGADALDRVGVVWRRDTDAHGANPTLFAMLGDWVMFFLALLLIPVLVIEETSSDPGLVTLATWTNAAIWLVFVIDYAVDVWRARDRRAHLASHWADLALIVVSPPLLVPPQAQALRVLRAFRLLRALAVVGIVAEQVGRPLTRAALLAVLAILAAVLLAGGILVIAAEPKTFPTVTQGYAWAIATLMTAGHADPAPTTPAGRAISTLITVVGLGTFAALAASIAAAKR